MYFEYNCMYSLNIYTWCGPCGGLFALIGLGSFSTPRPVGWWVRESGLASCELHRRPVCAQARHAQHWDNQVMVWQAEYNRYGWDGNNFLALQRLLQQNDSYNKIFWMKGLQQKITNTVDKITSTTKWLIQ